MKRKLTPAEQRAADQAREAYEAIAAELTDAVDIVPAKMMGMPCLKIRGKMALGLFNDSMTFKLGGPRHAEALALPGAKLFDPSGVGRAMKEWVQVPHSQQDRWRELAQASLDYVGRGAG